MRQRLMVGAASFGIVAALCLTVALGAASSDMRVVDAALAGNRASVRALLAQGAEVNAARGDGVTALHAAAMAGDVDMARILLAAGAGISASTRLGGLTPLDLAAKNGHAAMVALLLKHGANPNAADQHGTTPLMLAAGAGSTPAVLALLKAGANPNAKESARSETALMFAAAYGRTDVVNALLAHGADWRPTSKIFDWTKLPMDDPRLGSGDPRVISAKGKQAATSKAATTAPVNEGATRNEGPTGKEGATGKESTTHRPAHRRSYVELVGTQGGLTALMFAARQGHMATVKALVAAGADVNEIDPGDHSTPLLVAIINGRFDIAMYLVAHEADPNLAELNGATPLYDVLNTRWVPKSEYPHTHYDAQQRTSYLTLMKALLDHGAKPNVRLKSPVWYTSPGGSQSGIDQTGASPFWRAAYADDVPAMKLLLKYGTDPTISTIKPAAGRRYGASSSHDFSGLPPVPVGGADVSPLLAAAGEGYGRSFTSNHHHFAAAGMLPAVKFLVEVVHADVNARDAQGYTALHYAAARGDNAMILYLVSKGADVTAVNRNGQTVADMANGPYQRTQQFPQTLALLTKLGARVMHACVSC